jgi:U32 family peptidase
MNHSQMLLPELLAPGGGPAQVRTALLYGADAVYVGGELSLRAKATGLNGPELDRALRMAHAQGARVYYCLNVFARQCQMREVAERVCTVAEAGVDAIIASDPGVIRLIRRIAPALPIHLSTQANTTNAESLAFWRDQGVSRVNLARELGMAEIKGIVRAAGGIEAEVFVHGAMCMAVSGQCMLSSHLTGRSANLGLCAHPCRYEYRSLGLPLEERTRPGRALWEVLEEDGYSTLLAPEDLCLLPYLPWFCRVGLSALKIEGRTKTAGYLAPVVDVYRTALDDLRKGRFRRRDYLREVSFGATRELATGFFLPGRRKTLVPAATGSGRTPVVGVVEGQTGTDAWMVLVLSRWEKGIAACMLLPGLQRPELEGYALEQEDGTLVQTAHSGTRVILRCASPGLREGVFLRAAPDRAD